MGVHTLVTGLNGSGKTLYCVATKLRGLSEQTFEYRGETLNRRIVQGGINGLMIDHELMYVPSVEIDPETFVDQWKAELREPGTPAREGVPVEIFNWWLWCKPGDLIVVDECQRVFRPMPSGRRVPMYISKLETARHYGVEFLYMTQHPTLLHQNVRKLVGPHEDIRRIFGSGRVMVYQWDRVSDPGRIAKATSRIWKHDKSAYKLYRSAELHHKFGQKLPFAVWGVGVGLVGLLACGWVLRDRLAERFHPVPKDSAGADAKGAGKASGGSLAGLGGGQGVVGGQGAAKDRWPVYDAEPYKFEREPLAGRAVQWEGGYVDGKLEVSYFGLFVDGERVATVTLAQLVRMGYIWKSWGPCVGSLRFGAVERLVTCGKRAYAPPAIGDGRGQAGSASSVAVGSPSL